MLRTTHYKVLGIKSIFKSGIESKIVMIDSDTNSNKWGGGGDMSK